MATPNASSRGYQALVTAELARAAGVPGIAAWSAAATAWQTADEPYPLAYTWLRLAEAAAAAGDRQDAGHAVRQAYALASRVGAAPIADEATALARRTRLSLDEPEADAVRPAAEDPLARLGLTEREREVLVLLAAGRSNPRSPGPCSSARRRPACTCPTSWPSSGWTAGSGRPRWRTASA